MLISYNQRVMIGIHDNIKEYLSENLTNELFVLYCLHNEQNDRQRKYNTQL